MSEIDRSAVRAMLFPKSAAVVGASPVPGKLGHTLLKNLIEWGFTGTLAPIHPRESEVLGRKAYPDLRHVPDPLDVIVVAVPSAAVLPVVEQAAALGIRAAVVISAGFSETGDERSAAAEQHLALLARDSGMAIVGPNCQGVLSARGRFAAWFGPLPERPGNGLFVSQSGGLAGTLIERMNRHCGGLFDTVVSLGNKCSVDEADLLDAATDGAEIAFAMCYIEGFGEGRGRAFVNAAARFRDRGKRVIVLKGGRSASGLRATSSHTGSLAGSDRVFSAAMAEAGVCVVRSIREFVDASRLLSVQRPRVGRRVLILTNLGGPGVVAADACEDRGLVVAPTPDDLRRTLRERVPAYCAVANPIDLAGDPAPERYGAILDAVYASDAYDGVVIVAAPLAGGERIANDIIHAYAGSPKPTAVCWMGGPGDVILEALERGGLPVFDMPEDAVGALSGILQGNRHPFLEEPKPGLY